MVIKEMTDGELRMTDKKEKVGQGFSLAKISNPKGLPYKK
jgi:hypothetical protein